MDFEAQFALLQGSIFFEEFTFSNTRYCDADGLQHEVADSIISLGDIFMIFQLKERTVTSPTSPECEAKWYENKVIGKAIRQVRVTVAALKRVGSFQLCNNRGHSITMATSDISSVHKIVAYNPHELLPRSCRRRKFHLSRSAGVVHLISASDYLGLVNYLVTPAEVSKYFGCRERMIRSHLGLVEAVDEHALLGQYLVDEESRTPDSRYSKFVERLHDDIQTWDMSKMLRLLPQRIVTEQNPTDSYCILEEIAKLMRHELLLFRQRLDATIDAASSNTFELPYRFYIPRTGCGFLFVPLLREDRSRRHNALLNLTSGNLYDSKIGKCVGISVIALDDGGWDIEWCRMERPWEFNAEVEVFLSRSYPFRPIKEAQIPLYRFKPE